MSLTVYFLSLCLPLLTILLVFGMKYFAAIRQAGARRAEDAAYRELAIRMAQLQGETAAQLAAMQATLARLEERTAAVEHILKQVE